MHSMDTGWNAELSLQFSCEGGRTRLSRREHKGPLMVQKPFYQEGQDLCHVYLLHPPGGMVGGDQLNIDVTAEENAMALITTPAAGKFYRSNGSLAKQKVILKLSPGSSLEWFPLENIVFNGARMEFRTRIDLSRQSRFIGWDIYCLGRPACNEKFIEGSFDQSLEIYMGNTPIRIERLRFLAGDPILEEAWGLGGNVAFGSMVCFPGNIETVDRIRNLRINDNVADHCTVTLLGKIILCRYQGSDVERAKKWFIAAWGTVRESMMQRKASPPRIWKT